MEENSNDVTLTGEHNDATLGNEFKGYTDFKTRLDTELRANAEGFVRIGYLLKVARDTDILKESGHKNVADFAAAEYGLTKDIVSRYIAINDRYSEGGYSDRLQAKFEGYGVSKLQEMLTLPDYIIDEITPTLTRAEIQEIKAEVKAENEITPIEVAIEAAAPEVQAEEKELSFTCRAWKQYFSADTTELEMEKFLRLECDYYHSLVVTDGQAKRAKELFFDVFGGRIVWARIPGVGRIMISVSNEQEDKVTFTNSRTGEKKVVNSSEAMSDIKELTDSRGCTSEVFKELFRAKSEETKLTESTKEETAAEDIMPKPGSWTYDKPKEENANNLQEIENAATKKYQDEIKAYKERTGWNPNDTNWTPEKGKEYEEKEKVAPVQQSNDIESQNDDSKPKNDDKKPKQLGHLEVGDKVVNIVDGSTGTMLGYCAGDYKIGVTGGGITLVPYSSTRWRKVVDSELVEAEHTAAGQEEPAGSEPKEIPDLAGRSVKIDNILDQMTDAYINDTKISDATLRFLIDKARELIEKAEEIIKLRDELNREALGDTETESTEAADGDD